MTQAPIIRFAVTDDAEAIAGLFVELGHPVGTEEMAARLARFEQLGEEALVAQVDGEVVGVCVLHATPVLHRPAPVGRLTAVVVRAALRGAGVGRALVAASEARLRERGCELLELTSNMPLVEAHAFYERLGFEKTSYRFFKPLAGVG
jgi:GNAT superfamily N-acetyltransferase